MPRYIYQDVVRDGDGNVISSATVTVYLAGTTTLASVYTASSGGTAVNSVTTDSSGGYEFYVDGSDYNTDQKFKIVISKSGYNSQTYDDINIFPAGVLNQFTYQNDSLADDGTVNLPNATSGMVFVSCNAEGGMWLVQNTGAVVKIAGSSNTAATNADGNLCVYDGGTYAIVKNRLGTTGEIRIIYHYQ